jgi:ribosomal protein S12 methylthiotransferase
LPSGAPTPPDDEPYSPQPLVSPLARSTPRNGSKGTCSLITLGCPKNLVDGERMLRLLHEEGYKLARNPKGADFVLVNTCGFIEDARKESLETIREMVELKQRGLIGGVIVAGCLAERDKEALLEQCPGIDQLVGVFAREQITVAADRLMGGRTDQRSLFCPAPGHPWPDRDRLRVTPRHLAYLKIAEGCDQRCTFCAIPAIRGPYASKPVEEVVAEAESLAADGVRELILIAQDTSAYGVDLAGRPQLARLLARLNDVEGLEWIRLMYLYPRHFTRELIDVLASGGKVLPYLDLPLEHIHDRVLRRMNRGVSRADVERLLDRLRERIPGLVLRTTLIAGFPGETEGQFEDLLQFVRERRFERLGVFVYCRESGTPAARLPGQLPEAVRQSRRDRLMSAQQEIAFAWNESQVGRQWEVLIDRGVPGRRGAYVGRTRADAPEVDGVVYATGRRLSPGRIVPCEIVATEGYDLVAVAVGAPR